VKGALICPFSIKRWSSSPLDKISTPSPWQIEFANRMMRISKKPKKILPSSVNSSPDAAADDAGSVVILQQSVAPQTPTVESSSDWDTGNLQPSGLPHFRGSLICLEIKNQSYEVMRPLIFTYYLVTCIVSKSHVMAIEQIKSNELQPRHSPKNSVNKRQQRQYCIIVPAEYLALIHH
jgi:hypothetical protein